MIRSEASKQHAKEYRKIHSKHYAELNRNWIRNNRDKYNASKARYRLKLKLEVMKLYSDPVECAYCGFKQIDGLVLDHVANDGAHHRRTNGLAGRSSGTGMRIYEFIRKHGKIPELQVLCANCNTIKQLRHGRHKTIKDPVILAEIEELYENPNP